MEDVDVSVGVVGGVHVVAVNDNIIMNLMLVKHHISIRNHISYNVLSFYIILVGGHFLSYNVDSVT